MREVSVVVPVYNAERYIEKTIESLLCQDREDIEIILVDDGSTDGSAEICRGYAREDARITYIRSVNAGPGSARNIGMQKAAGEWIAFCDADDLVDRSMYDKLLARARETCADLCVCDFYSERDGQSMGFPWEGDLFEGKDVIDIYMASMVGNVSDNDAHVPFWGSSCRALYKRDIIRRYGITFPEDIHFAEDLVFNLRYTANCRCVAVLRETLYFYTYNGDSIMNSHCCRYAKAMFEQRRKLVGYIEQVLRSVGADGPLWGRLKTTERCYYSECIGNACTRSIGRTAADMLGEVRKIVNDEHVRAAFSAYDAKRPKKRILFFAMKYRLSSLLFAYYRLRLFRREKV